MERTCNKAGCTQSRAVVRVKGERKLAKQCRDHISEALIPYLMVESGVAHNGHQGLTKKCGAQTRNKASGGRKCARPAGWGTDHYGIGYCKWHGGSTAPQRRSAYRQMAMADFEIAHADVKAEPHEALIWCVEQQAKRAVWLQQIDEVQSIEDLGVKDSPANVFSDMLRNATKDLAQYSKMALDAGVDERRVQIAERTGDLIVKVLQHFMSGIELTPEQKAIAPEVTRKALATIEGTSLEKGDD